MGCYWLGELLPIPVTSLIPVILFPVLGVMTTAEVLLSYFSYFPNSPTSISSFLLTILLSYSYLSSPTYTATLLSDLHLPYSPPWPGQPLLHEILLHAVYRRPDGRHSR